MSLINPTSGASVKSYRAEFSFHVLPRSRPHPFSRNRSLLLPTESIVSSCTPFRIISLVPHLYRLFRFLGYVFGYLCTLQYRYTLSLLEFDSQFQNKAVSLCLLISPALPSFPLIALS
ncbi:Vegetative incompatibility protein HET-E-1 [Fusarium oxysporum f. sp. albedinis]|nr:Vegetative incompatibility protein HET-E-1 [Fusarium oxysporum f. sp. albedinis]